MTFEIIALDKARGGRVKKETHLRARSTLATPTRPGAAQGQETASEPTHRSTNAQRPRRACDRSSLAEATEAAYQHAKQEESTSCRTPSLSNSSMVHPSTPPWDKSIAQIAKETGRPTDRLPH